jgi:lantibiotic biosynthesis protein
MQAVCLRPAYARYLESPTFCHGVSGLLQVMLRFAHDTGLNVFADVAVPLTEQLIGMHEPGTLAGYRSVEMGGTRIDTPGLLDGAACVVITLLAADAEPAWDRAYLLA